MEVCPITALRQSPVAPQLKGMVRTLLKLISPETVAAMARTPGTGALALSVEAIEAELIQLLSSVGCAVLQEVLERLDASATPPRAGATPLRLALCSQTHYMSRLGPVAVRRSLYRAPGRNTPTVCPLEHQAGIVGGFWLPGAARVASVAMADLTATEAQRLLQEIGLMRPSASSLGRLPTTVSTLWETQRETHEAQLRAQTVIPAAATTVCVSVDGVLVPMKSETPAQRQARPAQRAAPGKHGSGPGGYREVGCGTLSFHDGDGERLHTLYRGRMPETKKVTLHQQLEADLQQVHAQQPDLRRVYLADGADINWQIAAALEATVQAAAISTGTPYRPAVEVVDFYHACEHLKRGCDAVFGEGSGAGQLEFAKLKAKLKEADHGVELVINALRYRVRQGPRANARLQAELSYFRHQRHRMQYAHYRRDHLPIASGVVEAACKTLATQRLKRSGMAWRQAGGQAILMLRAWLRSEQFDAAWQIITHRVKTPAQQNCSYVEPRLRLVA